MGRVRGATRRVEVAVAYARTGPLVATVEAAAAQAAAMAALVPVPVATTVLCGAKGAIAASGATSGIRGAWPEVATNKVGPSARVPVRVPTGVPIVLVLAGLGRPTTTTASCAGLRPSASAGAIVPTGAATCIAAVLPTTVHSFHLQNPRLPFFQPRRLDGRL